MKIIISIGHYSNIVTLDVVVKPEDNDGVRGVEKLLSSPESKMQVWLLPTNEELVIARDAYKDLMANA